MRNTKERNSICQDFIYKKKRVSTSWTNLDDDFAALAMILLQGRLTLIFSNLCGMSLNALNKSENTNATIHLTSWTLRNISSIAKGQCFVQSPFFKTARVL